MSGTAGLSAPQQGRMAYTLVEVLVVVAVIALLISILVPSLSLAREQARAIVCAQHLRQFGTGLHVYTCENNDYFPGLNTSGAAVTAKRRTMNSDVTTLFHSRLPVQTFDWMTPILAYSLELPAVRAQRFRFLLEEFRCPSQMTVCTEVFSDGPVPDEEDFKVLGAWPAISYLMPSSFQYVGQNYDRLLLCHEEGAPNTPIWAKALYAGFEVVMGNYLPKLERVGPAARKIFAADGTRYCDRYGQLDFAIDTVPDWYGSFSSPGGWYTGCTAYGVRAGSLTWDGRPVAQGSPSAGQNLALSYRHGQSVGEPPDDAHGNTGAINAAFFDGHVDRLTDRQSRAIWYWYPAGGVVNHPEQGMTNVPHGYAVP